MNVDEAMEIADSSNFAAEWYDGSLIEAVGVLRKEVERLRAELAEAKAENVGLAESHYRVEVELAAAKAASVLPVKFWWRYESNECDILIHGMNDEDSTRFGNWLDERMKDTNSPAATKAELDEIDNYEDQDPRSMGWVGSDGLP